MTTTAASCAAPGCGGTIEDGYCTVCGLAAQPAAPTAGGRTPVAATCAAPGCGGTIEDGYCTVCGLAAQPAAPTAGGRPSAGGPPVSRPPVSGPSMSGPSMSIRTGSIPSGRRSGTSRTSRGRLGAGLVDIPPVPAQDPAQAVLTDPHVPESKRFCGSCERRVGQGRAGQPGLAEGFCPHCGAPFSFVPKLTRGEMVAGQYEVLGCLAHGGLGWIYLAMDHNLSNRWVVLKGLLNTGDAAAQQAALAERRFLAQVEHPSIVGVYNFVQHTDQQTGESAGYIVMEYVGGRSLKQILQDRRATGESLPLPVALAYAIEILPALGYLHSKGLVYCDFKPDNVIQREEQLKLIDMGGVRRIDDADSAIYGTIGYQAPEIAERGPSPSSDLYTVGRALAVLTFEFAGYQSTYSDSLPDPATVPLLATQESFRRALQRATHPDPDQRFATAAEMAEQLTGVLREVLAAADQQPRPAFSTLFSGEVQAIGMTGALTGGAAGTTAHHPPPPAEVVAGLPVPQVDTADPAAGYLATLSTLAPDQHTAALEAAAAGEQGTPPTVADSPETRLALARALIVAGNLKRARAVLAEPSSGDLGDWRTTWYQGLCALAAGSYPEAWTAFEAIYDALPGEPGGKLALAFAAEGAGDLADASRYFEAVWTADRSFVSAAFGLARTRLADGDRAGAIAALAGVPPASSHYEAAQIAAVRIHVSPPGGQPPVAAGDLREAGSRVARLTTLDAARQQQLTGEVLDAALARVLSGEPLDAGGLLGCEPTERSLRLGLERCYREQARLSPGRQQRIELVDRANIVRPRTMW